jgi:hypothetical protein
VGDAAPAPADRRVTGREKGGEVAGEEVRVRDVRREVDGPVYDAMTVLEGRGWRFVRLGHKFTARCPCGDRRGQMSINGTPRNPGNHAKKILRLAQHCPGSHDLDA